MYYILYRLITINKLIFLFRLNEIKKRTKKSKKVCIFLMSIQMFFNNVDMLMNTICKILFPFKMLKYLYFIFINTLKLFLFFFNLS